MPQFLTDFRKSDMSEIKPNPSPCDNSAAFVPRTPPSAHILVVALASFAGPLDLLLSLVRKQKVDLQKISILQIAEQYLAFIGQVKDHQLIIDAEYLVMAAWLAWIKSKLLLPDDHVDSLDEETASKFLSWRLARLAAMQKMAQILFDRPRLGRDFWPRGSEEQIVVNQKYTMSADLPMLLRCHMALQQPETRRPYRIARLRAISISQAVAHLHGQLDLLKDWRSLADLAPKGSAGLRCSALASTLAASLQLAQQGAVELSQKAHYEPINIRRRQGGV